MDGSAMQQFGDYGTQMHGGHMEDGYGNGYAQVAQR